MSMCLCVCVCVPVLTDEEEDIDAQVAETKAAARVAVAARRLLALGAVIKLMLAPAALSQDDRDWLAARMLAQVGVVKW